MRKTGLTFRCPDSVTTHIDELMESTGISFSDLMVQALDLYVRHINAHGGLLMAPYTLDEVRNCGRTYQKALSFMTPKSDAAPATLEAEIRSEYSVEPSVPS